ncbi:anthranilate synthase component I [Patescibacteria group bacterium]|nr:anthranilate synthase component I [Patescibacteria group bacterium]
MINVISTYKEIKEEDPEAVYKAVKSENSYLLESAEGGEKAARYSFIGFNPAAKLTIKDGKIGLEVLDPELRKLKLKGREPLEILENLISQFGLKKKPFLRFSAGFVGYFSYDLVRYFHNSKGKAKDDLKEPDCEFILAKNNIIFDHKKKKTYLISHQFSSPGQKIDRQGISKDLEEISKKIIFSVSSKINKKKGINKSNNFLANIPLFILDSRNKNLKKKFEENVKKAKKYISAGDVFQVVLSQRLETDFVGDKFRVYNNLKKINPSPYMYYLDFGERKIVGSSPEMLVRVENRKVETYPIAGTRPRGRNPKEDKELEKEMLNDEKEKAEHIMLVDLARNDLGRVAKFGSVKVKKLMAVEKYSHVQHLVSEVSGELKDDEDEFSAFKSIFPAGTVSGAPKVRAMEIIDELEPTKRGIYSGAIGYFSFNRNMDAAITIRTIIFEKNKAYIQTGAGIVAESNPEKEYQEAMNKAEAMLKAIVI